MIRLLALLFLLIACGKSHPILSQAESHFSERHPDITVHDLKITRSETDRIDVVIKHDAMSVFDEDRIGYVRYVYHLDGDEWKLMGEYGSGEPIKN